MKSYSLLLPFPPSNNTMHRNATVKIRHKSKNYVKWLKEADRYSLTQKPLPTFTKRVDITVYLGGGASNYDCDNFNKVSQDYIVRLGIIKDDSKPYVRSTKQVWDDKNTRGCLIHIEECEDD